MNQFERFQDALNLENTEDNKFLVNPNTNYFVGNTPHGGSVSYTHLTLPTKA